MVHPINAIILAGGQGRRMGMRDKGLLVWRGKTLIEHTLKRIAPQLDAVIINCNRNQQQYRKLPATLCEDLMPDYQGPLAGIQAALTISNTRLNLVCACDTPQLPMDLLSRLLETLQSSHADLCYPWDGNREQYLPVLLRSTVLPGLTAYLNQGGRSINGWYGQLNAVSVDFSDCPEAFRNFNHSSELVEGLDK